MPRFISIRAFRRAYVSVLKRLIPPLENQLYRRLERLEAKLALYELRHFQSQPRKAMQKSRRSGRRSASH